MNILKQWLKYIMRFGQEIVTSIFWKFGLVLYPHCRVANTVCLNVNLKNQGDDYEDDILCVSDPLNEVVSRP